MRDDSPSLTALGVALIRSALERAATPTGDPAGEEALTAALLRNAPERFREWAKRREATRGFLEFVAARTEFFDRAVLRAIDAGIGQVVILGAGYCGRALRFRAPGVRFFEVDHPATQADKRSRLERLGVRSDDIAFVTADFTEPSLDRALESAGHRRDEPSLFMLEGVLRYLPERWFRELLTVVAARAAAGSELAVSISTRPPAEHEADARARIERERDLASSGEPVLTVPEREVALCWLAEAGWTADAVLEVSGARPGRLLILAHP